jgi:hypothetical protein
MSLETDLQALGNHEHFARFLKVVADLREETIEELHNTTNLWAYLNLRSDTANVRLA